MSLPRRVLLIHGKDRVRFLDDLLSVHVEAEMPLRYGALLSAQGKIEADIFLWSEGEALALDLHEGVYDSVKAKFAIYRLRSDVNFEDDPRRVWQIGGEGDPRGAIGARVYGEGFEREEMSVEDYAHARIEALVPEFGEDFGAGEAYPREWRFDEMAGVDYRKGCFVGQEIVARMRHKTDLLKTVLRVRGDTPLERGAEIVSGEKVAGRVLTVFENQALAFCRLKALDVDDAFADGVKLDFIGL